jgi:antitoxin StbD
MTHIILSDLVTSVSEFKKHPMQVIRESKGDLVAVLNRNQPVFYCVSPKMLAALFEALDDASLIEIIRSRENEPEIEVDIDDL